MIPLVRDYSGPVLTTKELGDARSLPGMTDAALPDSSSKFKSLSKESKDLLKKLLVKNPDKRISASEALEHIWIKKFAPHTKVNRVFSRKIFNITFST